MSLSTILNPGKYELTVIAAEAKESKIRPGCPIIHITFKEQESGHTFVEYAGTAAWERFKVLMKKLGTDISEESDDASEIAKLIIGKSASFNVTVMEYMNRYYNQVHISYWGRE